MTVSAFDPLAAVQALEAAGVDRRHAVAYATQLRVVANAARDRHAASAGLASCGNDLGSPRGKLGLLRRDLDSFRRELRYGMGIVSALNLVILGRLFGIL